MSCRWFASKYRTFSASHQCWWWEVDGIGESVPTQPAPNADLSTGIAALLLLGLGCQQGHATQEVDPLLSDLGLLFDPGLVEVVFYDGKSPLHQARGDQSTLDVHLHDIVHLVANRDMLAIALFPAPVETIAFAPFTVVAIGLGQEHQVAEIGLGQVVQHADDRTLILTCS